MEILIKAAAISAAAAVLGLVIKKSNPEAAMLLALCAAVSVTALAVSAAGEISGFLTELGDLSQMAPAAVKIVMKTVAVSITAKITSDACKDAGQSALSSAIELLGAVTGVYLALPLFKTALEAMEILL